MMTDALLLFSDRQDMTSVPANTGTPSNVVDFSQAREFGPTEGFKVYAAFSSLPTGASGAKITVNIQVSVDNQNWTTVESLPDIEISNITDSQPFFVRSKPAYAREPYRYMRLTYNPTAVLTSGTITAGIAMNVPGQHAYPKNFVA